VKIEQVKRDEEVAMLMEDEIAPWILNPKTSKFYRF
jgi:hypothetical protein